MPSAPSSSLIYLDSSALVKLVVAERTLDAIHLATARSLDRLAGIVSYDARLSRAASRVRFKVWSPV